MNEQDDKAFDEINEIEKFTDYTPSLVANVHSHYKKIFLSACEYKQKEIDGLKEIISYLPRVPTQSYEKEMAQRIRILEQQNEKLRECVEATVDRYFDLPMELRLQKGLKEDYKSLRARKVLKEIGE